MTNLLFSLAVSSQSKWAGYPDYTLSSSSPHMYCVPRAMNLNAAMAENLKLKNVSSLLNIKVVM